MRVVYMGTPAFAIPPLEELLASGYDVVGVYTQPDRPAGRGRSMEAPPVKTFALERGLEVIQPTTLRNPEAHSRLAALSPDLIAIAAYGRILPEEVVGMAPAGCVNVHPSMLPRHRGPSPVAFTILEGDETAGVSIMLLDEGMDSGPVIAQVEEPIHPEDTTESLTDRLFRRGAKLLVESLPRFLQGDSSPQPQDDAGATYARRLTKEDGEIRWELPAETLWRQVRAYHPWPVPSPAGRAGCSRSWRLCPCHAMPPAAPAALLLWMGTSLRRWAWPPERGSLASNGFNWRAAGR